MLVGKMTILLSFLRQFIMMSPVKGTVGTKMMARPDYKLRTYERKV
jgi:hypothetical protein